MKVLLAVDGSSYTKRMLAYIAAHPALVGADNEFIAVNVTPQRLPHVDEHPTHETLRQFYADEGEKVLGPVRAFAAMQGWPLRVRHVIGQPGPVLAEIVNVEQPDLLVMGSHGHGAFAGALLGSVSARVLAQTKAPVLFIR